MAKKKSNPHKREFGIEIIENQPGEIRYKVSIDIGFRSSGITLLDTINKKWEAINYKKNIESQVQGMKLVNLLNLCNGTLKKYLELLPKEVLSNLDKTQFILEEPLLLAGQKSFSISLYILLSNLVIRLIQDFNVHSIILVVPGSAKKLLGYKHNVKMPDSVKTKTLKEIIPELGVKNNHQADAAFSMILTNQELLKEYFPSLKILNIVEFQIYKSSIDKFIK